jgi:hypothetical protein
VKSAYAWLVARVGAHPTATVNITLVAAALRVVAKFVL